jgi:MoaA/NifB/PqqE/SkfB family radical SAM enzyme
MDEAVRTAKIELSLDEIERISGSIGTMKGLLISGGEPFLRKDLPQICKLFYSGNGIKSIHLPTNGFFTDDICDGTREILRNCPKANVLIGLPLDGSRETHDAVKGMHGSFDKAVETAVRLAELKKEFNTLRVYVITTVTAENIEEIEVLAEFVKNTLPVDGHGPSPVRGTSYSKTVRHPSAEAWDRLSRSLMKYHSHWNSKTENSRVSSFLSTNRTRYLYKVYAKVLEEDKLPFLCHAGKSIGVLEPDGGIRLCEQSRVFGNIRSFGYDFPRAWQSDAAMIARGEITQCACTHACFLLPSIRTSLPAFIQSSVCMK